ncbi:MAG: stage II sporulation protein M [Dethiobacteria bacterium]|jgi:stage II sporulation protein M|nr:stage II sporulation protein M [Bacillota bacterium]HOA35358.1 stage II sporulation protein M [Bacillota bacterium]HOJ84495.1 stage II sporulation protein M [Bacillota bacterium]HOL14906.1 stage II sporulation protein M [Bacillota bacterium]HQE09973.1 stage II sporulation protein M [Bacillota bacterium]
MPVFSLLLPVKDVLRQNRNWLLLAVAIFLAGSILAYFAASAPQSSIPGVETQIEGLETLFNLILENPPYIAALMILLKNFMAMAQMLFLGAFAGISPLATLSINGFILGLLAASVQEMGMSIPAMIVFGILPHGIFELFAFFLCGALGLKLGYHCVASPLPGKTRLQSFKYIWKEIVSVMPLVTALLILAALIEIFVTPHLLSSLI